LPARPLERQRFRPDLLFVLRLLLLLALVAGYALPWVGRPGGDAEGGLAIVLDVSASMQVREAGGGPFRVPPPRRREAVGPPPPRRPPGGAPPRPPPAGGWRRAGPPTGGGPRSGSRPSSRSIPRRRSLRPSSWRSARQGVGPVPASRCSPTCHRRRARSRRRGSPGSTGSRSGGATKIGRAHV